jgi:predicted ATPase
VIEFREPKDIKSMIQSFHIKNYRGFKDFKIEPFGRVNLITGANNVGKTALLEALYLNLGPVMAFRSNLDSSPVPESSTAHYLFRGFVRQGLGNIAKWGWLFHGKDLSQSVELTSKDEKGWAQKLKMDWLIEDSKGSLPIPSGVPPEDLQIYLEVVANPRKRGNVVAVIDVGEGCSEGESHVWRIEKHGGDRGLPAPYLLDLTPLRLLFSMSSRSPEEDTKWFSRLADIGRQDEVVGILRLIEPRLKDLAVSTSDGPAMIYGDIGVGRRVPMSQMGEGMVRLLSLVLEITNGSGGVVLIDEIESGLHHSVLTKVWRAIGEAARRSDTQVFATTHSLECIRAAHEAFLLNGTYDLRLHRLERINGYVKAVTYDQETLDTSVEMNLEVR